jgi:N-acetylglutamate synthase-like GNAT family acetyltransferase
LEVRFFNAKEDYPIVSKWWIDWKQSPMPLITLPRTGMIVSNEKQDICCAWLYITDSCICIISWVISDRYSNKSLREGCIEFLLKKLEEFAKKLGFKAIFSSSRHPFLINKMKKVGYIEAEDNMINFFKKL